MPIPHQQPDGMPVIALKIDQKEREWSIATFIRTGQIPLPDGITIDHPFIRMIYENGFQLREGSRWSNEEVEFVLVAYHRKWTYDELMLYTGRTNSSLRKGVCIWKDGVPKKYSGPDEKGSSSKRNSTCVRKVTPKKKERIVSGDDSKRNTEEQTAEAAKAAREASSEVSSESSSAAKALMLLQAADTGSQDMSNAGMDRPAAASEPEKDTRPWPILKWVSTAAYEEALRRQELKKRGE